jgi:hypothetical protein
MLASAGELKPGSLKVVVVETSTVTMVVVLPVPARLMVKVVVALVAGAVTTLPDCFSSGSLTEVAPTVLVPAWVPVTSTWSPAKMLARPEELKPGWARVVVVETSTVTRSGVPPDPATFMVKLVGALLAGKVTTVPDCLSSGSLTEVAPSVLVPAWVPVTLTWSPAKMLARAGELKPGWARAVVVEMSTVTRVVVPPVPATFIVKLVGALLAGAVTTVPATGLDP